MSPLRYYEAELQGILSNVFIKKCFPVGKSGKNYNKTSLNRIFKCSINI
jgi:hypothetical protein